MKRFWLAAWMLLLGFAGGAFAAPFTNGSFEVGAPSTCNAGDGLVAGSSAIPGWTVSVGNVDWTTACNWTASEGTHSLDLVGGNTNIGGVAQTFDTVPGATYQVSFDLAGNPSTLFPPAIKPLTVTVAGITHNYTFDTTGKTGTAMGWATQTFTFVASGSSATIDFRSNVGVTSFAGAALDNVRIQQLNAWTGSAGSVTNQGTPIGSAPTVVSDGTAGTAAEFTYQTVNSFCCHTGNWTFNTTAATDGDVSLNWTYAGYHGTCQATASLTAYVRRLGVDVFTAPLYSASDSSCNGALPSGGFGQYGKVSLPGVLAGDEYGFRMTASNFDSNGGVGGTLTVTTGASPTTTAVGSSANPILLPRSIVFTATVTGSTPTGQVTFTQEGREIQGCIALPLDGNTAFCFVPDWFGGLPSRTILALYSGDSVNAGSVSSPFLQTVTAGITAPSAPFIGTATVPTGSQTATITWAPPTSNGGSPITGYTITSSPGGLTQSAAAAATSGTVSGLQFGQSYTFTVTATNAVGTSPPSSASNSVTPQGLAPTLILASEDTSGTFATVIGRVNGALPGVSVQPIVVASCINGVAGASPVPIGTAVAPNGDGYVVATPSGVASGQFVALQLVQSGTPISGLSSCLPSLSNNDFWTTALLVGPDNAASGSTSANDYVDAPGKARWYKFKVAPGQQISVSLTGIPPNALPADYDLAVFKDIGAAFTAQLDADPLALTKLSAEFAPSTFSPSTFSPSTFSPSTFSPSTFSADAFAPSTFSPSTFSPSTFSPSTFSPSTFSPSTFSPSTFSPSTFSPSTFSPSTFSPSTFSPSTFSADIIRTAFSSAQTRSLIGVSATAGIVNESVVVDSWNNSGYFYARVTGRNGAFSTSGQLMLNVTKGATSCSNVTDTTLTPRSAATATGITTVILTDTSSFAGNTAGDMALMSGNLAVLASSTGGVVVDVKNDNRVQTLKTQAAANAACPFATNLVAEEVKGIVDSYRGPNNPGLRFVVIAGGDDVIPFFRYPDQTMLGQESDYVPPVTGTSDASLRGNFVLSQDAYGSKTRISLRTSDYPVPGLAVGRLVKTPAEIAGMIDAALPNLTTNNNGALQPSSSLVTGYDFLADVAGKVANELQSATNATPDQLIAPNNISPQDPASWHASDLAAKLFGSRHDVIFLAGHFSANSALAADFATNLITSDVAGSKTDFTNSIVFSAGCHSGYSIVNRDALSGVTFTLDWAEAFAQKKATLIAGTGYQYGDTDFTEYSERLYLNFARELHAGLGPVAIGEALVNAKIDYLAATPDIRGIHTKALLESTLYGLPMLGVNMPAGRGGNSAVTSAASAVTPTPVSSPGLPAGLRVAGLSLSPSVTTKTLQLTGATTSVPGPLATWLEGDDGVVSNPSEPAIPLKVVNATPNPSTLVLRGVGFRGGSYTDSLIVPLTGAPATDIRGVHTSFAAPNFFPNRPWTVNYFGALFGNGATSLLITPAQHRGASLDPVTNVLRSTLRKYNSLDLRLYYSDNRSQAALSDAPTIVSVDAQSSNPGGVVFTAQVTGDPATAIYQVWVLYTDGNGAWMPVDLVQCGGPSNPPICGSTTDSQIWKGSTPGSAAIQYVVQAASGIGLVTFDDNRGAYYAFNPASFPSTTAQAAAAVATALAFESAPTSATYGDTVSVTASLTSGGQPVVGGLVALNIGGFGNSGLTDANGRVTLSATVSSAPGNSIPISASYAGSATLLASSVVTSFAVNKASASLTPLASGVGVKVTAPVVVGNTTTQQPVAGQSVSYVFSSTAFTKTLVINTDNNGNATVPTAGLPAGTYSVTASFLPAALAGKDTYYLGATQALASFTMNAQSVAFTTVPPPPPASVSAPTLTFQVAALSGPNVGLPVAITSTTPDVCTVTGQPAPTQASYTATIIRGDANCVLSADVAGNNNYAPASALATIQIAKAAQTITSFTAPTAAVTYAPPGTFSGAATASTPNSGKVVTITTNTPAICTVADTPVTNGATYTATIVAGDANCTLAADLDGNDLYTAAHRVVTIPIVKAAQAITIDLPSDCSALKTYGNPPFNVSVTSGASGQPVTFTSTNAVCTVTSSAGITTVAIGGAGTCSITANQAFSDLYKAAPQVTKCFTVNQAGQTIGNFGTIPPKTYGVDGSFRVSPSSTSSAGFPVTLSAVGNCTIDSPTPPANVTLTGKGTCTITASAPGNANYAAVSPAQSFSIAGSPQTITFANPGDKALGTAAFRLTASTTSNLPVTFAVLNTDICTLLPDGVTLKPLAPGVCTLTASQSGTNSNYAAATNVPQQFKVYLSGFAGLTSVTIGASKALVDSFDSTPGLGGYAATRGAAVNVLSNGTINVQGTLWGNVESAVANVVVGGGTVVTGNVTAGTTISNSGTVSGTTAPNMPLPPIEAPAVPACAPFTPATPSGWISGNYTYDAAKGDLTVSGQNTATLAGGSYCLHSITLNGGATLAVSGPVKINLTGAFTASGNSMVNPTLIPRNLQVATSYAGNNGVTMSGNATGYFTIYAPGTSVTLSGNAELFGAAVGKTFTGSGNPDLHYDVKTLDVWGTIFGF